MVSVGLAQSADVDRRGHQTSTATTAPGGNAGSGPPLSAATVRPQSGWWPTTTTVSPRPEAAARTSSGVCAGREPLVGLGVDPHSPGDLGSRLPSAQERAGQHGVRLDAVVREALPEQAGVLSPGLGEGAQVVGLAESRLRMTHDEEPHAARIRPVPSGPPLGSGAVIRNVPGSGGWLEVVCGPMFSGKSEELIRRLRRAEIAGQRVLIVKPGSTTASTSRTSSAMPARRCARSPSTASEETLRRADGYDVVGVDEAQFFEPAIVDAAQELVARGKRVVAAGLDRDFRCEPFGPMPLLLCLAEFVDKLQAVCHQCGGAATRTQRLVDGEPAPFDGATIQIGALDSYEARCSACYRAGVAVRCARRSRLRRLRTRSPPVSEHGLSLVDVAESVVASPGTGVLYTVAADI